VKIAVVSTPFVAVPPPGYGGTELVVANLVDELIARGHDVTLYATGDSRVAGADLRFIYEKARWPPDPYAELEHATFAMRDIVADGRHDLIHAHVPSALMFAPFVDLPVVYTIHHVRDETMMRLYRRALTPTLNLVAISERQRELLDPDVAEGAAVVHHGLDPDCYPLGPGGARAGFIGRFAAVKGPDRAIEVASAAGVPLELAGAPHADDADYFRDEVQPRLSRRLVQWQGEAGLGAKVRLLGGSLATLFPIDWEEPFGLVMIESMLCGTPVLSFPRGAALEVIDPGVTGWLCGDEDEMAWRLRRLARGTERFDRARCRARAAARFSVGVMVDRYLEVYADAIASPAEEATAWRAS
jgi:glycosyltransferase involved in cell wall biosynthesis